MLSPAIQKLPLFGTPVEKWIFGLSIGLGLFRIIHAREQVAYNCSRSWYKSVIMRGLAHGLGPPGISDNSYTLG